MKNKTGIDSDKGGGILLAMVLVMFIISILVAGLLMMQTRGGVEAIYARQSEQAFWLAEAGIHDVIQRLNWSPSYRSNPTNVPGTLGNGTYSASVVAESDVFSLINKTNYTIVSVGTVEGENRRIRQVVSSIPGTKGAIHNVVQTNTAPSSASNTTFNSNTEVHGGGVFIWGGSVDTGNNSSVDLGDGLFVREEEVDVEGDGTYTKIPIPEGLEPPSFDPSSFQAAYGGIVSGPVSGSITVSDSAITSTENYASNSVTFDARLTVPANAEILSNGDVVFSRRTTFSGPVTIKAGGNIIFSQTSNLPAGSVLVSGGNISVDGDIFSGSSILAKGDIDVDGGASVGADVEIVSGGNVAFGNQMTFGNQVTVYAEEDLSVASGGTSAVVGDGIAFLSNQSITVNANMDDFRGIMFSNGSIDLNANMDIFGTIISQGGIDVASNINIFHDVDVYSWVLDHSDISINISDVILTKLVWEEIAPL